MKPNLLYLVHRLPYPPDKGDRIRAFHLLKFASLHARVHLACLADEPVSDEAIATLQSFCEKLAVVRLGSRARWMNAFGSFARGRTVSEGAFSSTELRIILRAWVREIDFKIALASSSSMAPYLRLPELRNIPAVVDLVDVDSQKWSDYATASHPPRSWLYRTEARRLRRLETDLSGWARAVTLCSDRETQLHRASCVDGNVLTITNGVDLDYFHRNGVVEEPGNCVFVGALDYLPNVDAVCWFCREVWPHIRASGRKRKMHVVGRRPVRAVLRLGDLPGVEVTGDVPDVRPFLERAQVVVVPLRIARGVQNKVLEALAMGKPVVCSPQALAGLNAQSGTHLLTASTAPQWVATINQLFDDVPLRKKLAQAGRGYVEEHHRWDQCLQPFADTLGWNISQIEGASL